MAEEGKTRPSPQELEAAMKPALQQVFPPALLGRIVTIPYFPLSDDMLGGIVKIQLERIRRRIKDNHDADFQYSDAVVDYIVARCNDPDSGGRMIDNILTNSMLPEMSRQVLNRTIERKPIGRIDVDVDDGAFSYSVN
jgi:type VI secretion system protein VasG